MQPTGDPVSEKAPLVTKLAFGAGDEELPFLAGLRITLGNRAFRYVSGIYLLSWLVVQSVSAIIPFYLTYWLRNPSIQAPVILAVQGSALVWLMIWSRVSRSVGKKGVYYRGMAIWIVIWSTEVEAGTHAERPYHM